MHSGSAKAKSYGSCGSGSTKLNYERFRLSCILFFMSDAFCVTAADTGERDGGAIEHRRPPGAGPAAGVHCAAAALRAAGVGGVAGRRRSGSLLHRGPRLQYLATAPRHRVTLQALHSGNTEICIRNRIRIRI
jgi:hypothetical protein